jgi:pyruvate formate lyase activating enzyme
MKWKENSRIAKYWLFDKKTNKTECLLCPRHCKRGLGEFGFCGVRGNVNNEYHTFNYGRSVSPTIETIETEAVNHYSPGTRILSLGNIGCMMDCDFCQNWTTSQTKYLDDKNVFEYTPQQIIDIAKNNNIEMLSWTYNDPVVWHEFIIDTAVLAKKAGIKNLFKSALYIELEPLKELIEVMDIFSISSKSISDEYYRKYTKGSLKPVMDGILEIYKSGKHLEISRLIVTGLNDTEKETVDTVKWMLENLDSKVPFHFVAFHPAYKYINVPRTPLSTLIKARDYAINQGIEYCYIGNVYADGVSNTFCKKCGSKLVDRFGLTVNVLNLDKNSTCQKCGKLSTIKEPLNGNAKQPEIFSNNFIEKQNYSFDWNSENNGLHCDIIEHYIDKLIISITRFPNNSIEYLEINGVERFAISRKTNDETSIKIGINSPVKVSFLPLLDRAHFPVI